MLKRFTSRLPAIAMAGLLILGLSERAHADLAVTLNPPPNGGNTNSVTQAGFGNLAFSLVSGGQTAIGNAQGQALQGTAQMDMSAVTLSTTAPATLTLVFSQNGLTAPIGVGTISEEISGSFSAGTVGSISYTTFGSNQNTLFTTVPTGSQFQGSAGPVTTLGGSATGAFTATPPAYSLTEVLTVTFTTAGTFSTNLSSDSRAGFTAVPEPSTMAIAGLGSLGFIAYGLRRRKASGA